MAHFASKQTAIGAWIRQLMTRAHPNVVVVAVAAKLARIAWAVLRHGRNYEHQAMTA
jgi:transposase